VLGDEPDAGDIHESVLRLHRKAPVGVCGVARPHAAGLGSILLKDGLQYDIDFTGGALVEVRLAQPASMGATRSRLTAAGLGDSIIQIFDNPRDVLIRGQCCSCSVASPSTTSAS
jgi:preprotein translocase subunit SecF